MVIRLERARLNKCDALLRPSFLNQCSGLQNNPPTLSDPYRSDGCFPTLRDSRATHRLQSALFWITHKSVIIGSDSCLHQIQHGQIFLLMDCQTGEWENCWLGLDIDKGVALMWWCRFKDNVVTKFGEFFCPLGWFGLKACSVWQINWANNHADVKFVQQSSLE